MSVELAADQERVWLMLLVDCHPDAHSLQEINHNVNVKVAIGVWVNDSSKEV